MEKNQPNAFVFSSKYRVLRHVVFWIVHIIVFSFIFKSTVSNSLGKVFLVSFIWVPGYILYTYPVMYWLLPQYLLKGKNVQFTYIILLWGIGGWFYNYLYRSFILFPLESYIHAELMNKKNLWGAGSYLTMTTMLGIASMIVLFKYWVKKQQEWMQAEKEKVTAELQLLKAQLHPHFLFNTLNNIYSFSLENSSKTPELILKLSSLLSYMLYDCKVEQVLLEKELEVMKNYIDLEKERYGNKIEISVNIDGDIKDKYIAPLLLLPFLENAFKHGTSDQLEKPWLSLDLSVKKYTMKCKIVNSKKNNVLLNEKGIGVQNVKKRLAFLYPDKYELKIIDEEDFFVVSLQLELKQDNNFQPVVSVIALHDPEIILL